MSKKPRILIAGAGGTGTELAKRLGGSWQVTLIDTDAATPARLPADLHGQDGFRFHQGDATSALVLRKAELEGIYGAVACTGSDEVNIEVLRLARGLFGIANLFALTYHPDWTERYRADGIDIVAQDHAGAAILESRLQQGQKVATNVGLGIGEILEVEVLPNSSVIGRRLSELNPKRWLVGAVYRNQRLIVPHGDTVLAPGDKVLIIGDTEILPSIATLIRSGESEFPLQYGSHLVGLCESGTSEVLDEVRYLIGSTRADRFEIVCCSGDDARLEELARMCKAAGVPHEMSCTAADARSSLVEEAARRDVGVLVLAPERLPFLSRIGLGRSRTARMIDVVNAPVLVSRGTFPYKRVLVAMAELPFHTAGAQLAIDVARMVGADLRLGVVHQPEIVVGHEHREEMEQRRREVEKLAGLYRVHIDTEVMTGNPIRELLRACGDCDLLVMPYRRGRRSFLTRPDVVLNLIHRARCSVMIMPC